MRSTNEYLRCRLVDKRGSEQQVEERGYSTASEFVRDVLRREQDRLSGLCDARLLQALDSGDRLR